jgi:5-histidylcysteine sulfoxide synthase/putative 4-mercaptohistidine N1-methyltranferase
MSVSRNPNLNSFSTGVIEEAWQRNLGRSSVDLSFPRKAEWWTGLPPSACPGYSSQGKLHSLPIPNLDTCTRQQVLDYFNNTWTLSELLFSALCSDEPFYRPPYHGLRHPLIFYYVHPCALYINKLRVAGLIEKPLNPYFESLFETGVDEMSWDDMSKNTIEWPTVDEAMQYRRQVYSIVSSLISSHPELADGHKPVRMDHPLWALFMGFEHERIHLETSSVLIRELPVNLVSRPEQWPGLAPFRKGDRQIATPLEGDGYPVNSFVKVPASFVTLGKPQDWPTFGWDNEYGSRSLRLSEFEAGRYLASNAEYWQFVVDGAYHDESYWSEEGWRWRCFRNVKWPTFWVPDGPSGSHQYRLRTLFEVIPMQWDWPAVVNYHEAKAYCQWKSAKDGKAYRLLSEAEHYALRQLARYENSNRQELIVPEPLNANLRMGSESAVDGACIDPNSGIGDLFGNVWQWAEDDFNPLAGARIHKYYDDFSTPCYDGKHQMILGGSFVSTGDEATPWERFHFRPHFYQHAGFRIVHVPDGSDGCAMRIGGASATAYESDAVQNQYMTLHFGAPELQMPFDFGPLAAASFPQRCADLVSQWCDRLGIEKKCVLDIGCAVGGACFRLAESFESVTGVDLSEQFINAARVLKDRGELDFKCRLEGDLHSQQKASIPAAVAARVEFKQADACSLPADYLNFDAVLIANVLCRLPSPGACLGRLGGERGIVKVGGLLVIASPYSWTEEYSPRDVWLGGYVDDEGSERFSEDGLKQYLSFDFELVDQCDIPIVIREHYRKYQYIVTQALIFRRLK